MRRIEFLIHAEIPHETAGWLRLNDAIRSQWSMMNRKEFSGNTLIGYTWRTAKKPSWTVLGRVWRHLAKSVGHVVGGRPGIGPSRFVNIPAEETPLLTLTVEEDL